MVSSDITLDGLSRGKINPCEVYSLSVRANSVLSVHGDRWIHSRCARVRRVTSKFSRNFTCRKCEGNIGEAVEQEVMLCDEV